MRIEKKKFRINSINICVEILLNFMIVNCLMPFKALRLDSVMNNEVVSNNGREQDQD